MVASMAWRRRTDVHADQAGGWHVCMMHNSWLAGICICDGVFVTIVHVTCIIVWQNGLVATRLYPSTMCMPTCDVIYTCIDVCMHVCMHAMLRCRVHVMGGWRHVYGA